MKKYGPRAGVRLDAPALRKLRNWRCKKLQ
jgi:hypothetical protein